MGLFGKTDETEQSNLRSTQSRNAQAQASSQQVPDFNTLLQAPPGPPPELDENGMPIRGAAGVPPPVPPPSMRVMKEPPPLPGFSQVQPRPVQPGVPPPPLEKDLPPAATEDATMTPEEEAEFELPDFEEEEIRDLESPPEPEPKPPVRIPHSSSWTTDPNADGSEPQPEEKEEEKEEKEEEEEHPYMGASQSKQFVPEPEAPNYADLPSERFIDMRDFFKIRDELSGAKLIAKKTEEKMLDEGYKSELARYTIMAEELNAIQDKLLIIDDKIFED
ncbi:hypothetical protein JW711_05960 [Candidatus Woesearchaeota archaeon]|nr:hypothetical protein [Candidatus Woesearchaeota archaeon]